VGLDAESEIGKGQHFCVSQDALARSGGVEVHALVVAVRSAVDGRRLPANPGTEQPRARLVHGVGIRLDLTADDHLALAESGLDHHAIGVGA